MLDDRSKTLLKTLIERYIADGQPVGSRALSRLSGLDLSAATVRNVMADLEELGYIASPHTSAGRVPTPRGYRFFVDSLLTMRPLEAEKIHAIEGQLRPSQPQPLISSASHLLSGLTHFAGIVLSPRRKTPKIRQIEFVSLSEKRILLIIVTTDGDVQNRILFTERPYSAAELVIATNYLNQYFAGNDFVQIRNQVRADLQKIRGDLQDLMAAALADREDLVAGLVLTSSIVAYKVDGAVPTQKLESLRVPTLVVHHANDACWACRPHEARALGRQLVPPTPRRLVFIEGGGTPQGEPCGAFHHHGYIGQEDEVVDRIAAWILQPVSD